MISSDLHSHAMASVQHLHTHTHMYVSRQICEDPNETSPIPGHLNTWSPVGGTIQRLGRRGLAGVPRGGL